MPACQGWCHAKVSVSYVADTTTPLDEAHLHACLRYVELNPVRARLADGREAWPWSSARGHLGLADDPFVDPAPARARIDDWRAFLDEGLEPVAHANLRVAERSGRLLGTGTADCQGLRVNVLDW